MSTWRFFEIVCASFAPSPSPDGGVHTQKKKKEHHFGLPARGMKTRLRLEGITSQREKRTMTTLERGGRPEAVRFRKSTTTNETASRAGQPVALKQVRDRFRAFTDVDIEPEPHITVGEKMVSEKVHGPAKHQHPGWKPHSKDATVKIFLDMTKIESES
uniref:Uncharacterized protein n=1 Tax=Panagrellus redivivus TaxID=6233 RepID=A0A7E4VB79_PANRE